MATHGTYVGLVVVGAVLLLFGFVAVFSVGFPSFVGGLTVVVAGLTGVHRSHPSGPALAVGGLAGASVRWLISRRRADG